MAPEVQRKSLAKNKETSEMDNSASHRSAESDQKPVLVQPPDGGWGWLVVFGSFLVHILCDGVAYSFGIFVSELSVYFDSGKGAAGGVAGMMLAVTLLTGPVSGSLVNKFGCRAVTILGSIVAFIGLVLSIFANSIAFLYFSISFVTGLGFGLVYLPAICSVGFYFEKRRAFATGLAVCGSGLGTFVFAPISTELIDAYMWRGAILVLSAVILNTAVCGALFRPLLPKPVPRHKDKVKKEPKQIDTDADVFPKEDIETRGSATAGARTCSGDKHVDQQKLLTTSNTAPECLQCMAQRAESAQAPSGARVIYCKQHSTTPSTEPRESVASTSSYEPDQRLLTTQKSTGAKDTASEATVEQKPPALSRRYHSPLEHDVEHQQPARRQFVQRRRADIRLPQKFCISESNITHIMAHEASEREHKGEHHTHGHKNQDLHASKQKLEKQRVSNLRVDMFYQASLSNIPLYRSHPQLYKSATSVEQMGQVGTEAGVPEDKTELSLWQRLLPSSLWRTVCAMMEFSLFGNILFLMFAISNFLTSLAFPIPWIYIEDRAKNDLGVEHHMAAYLLSWIGGANTVARVFYGFLADQRRVNRLQLYNFNLIACGVACCLCPLCVTYTTLVLFCAAYGFFIGCYVALTSVILVDLLGLDKLTNSFGLLLLVQGGATAIGPIVLGWLRDITGAYSVSFVVSGVVLILSGVMLVPLPCIRDRRATKEGVTEREIAMGLQVGGLEDIELQIVPDEGRN